MAGRVEAATERSVMLPRWAGELPPEWEWHQLADVCLDIVDCPHSTPELVEAGPYLMARTSDILTGVFRGDEARRVSEATYRERTRRTKPTYGDLLYSREGTYFGLAAEIPAETKVCLGQRMVLLRPDPEQVHPTYLRFWLNSSRIQSHIQGHRDGSVAERLNLPTIRRLPVCRPSMTEQRAIAHILGTLDDKIELNRRMNQTLEAIARALFKSWFVDSDPVRAKAEGRDLGLPKPLADLFPDSFEDSEAGEVPKGWQVASLGDVLQHRVERCAPSAQTVAVPYVPIDCISSRSLFLVDSKSGVEAQSSLTRFHKGDILFGAMRPYFHKVCIAPFDGTTRTTAFVLSPILVEDFAYATLLMHDAETIDYATRHSTGSTIPYAMWSNSLADMPIVLPATEVRTAFGRLMRPLLERIPERYFESRDLAALRDTLLPKLISGEIRLRVGERTP